MHSGLLIAHEALHAQRCPDLKFRIKQTWISKLTNLLERILEHVGKMTCQLLFRRRQRPQCFVILFPLSKITLVKAAQTSR